MKNLESRTTHRLPRLVFAVLLSLPLAFAAAAQPKLGDTVYKEKKTPSESTKPKGVKKKGVSTPSQTTRSVPAARTTTPKNALEVTFFALEPQVEIYLNEKNVGVTDENFQLSKKLAPGDYLLMAKNKRAVLVSTKKISVGPEQTIFQLYEEAPPQPMPEPVKTVAPDEERQLLIKAIEESEQVKKILATYNDPATTDSVTVDDWQFVFKAANSGELQGYTAVQIEAQRWFASGQIELAKNEYVNAFTAFNKALEFMPQSPLPFLGLGNTYYASQKLPDALKLYTRAVQMDPKFAVAFKKIGDTQRQLGKGKEAIAAYKNAIQFGYKTLETRYWLGTLMLETKQIEEALAELESVAAEKPAVDVYLSIGSGYEKLRRDVSAIEAYQKAIATDSSSALAHVRLADVYFNQREYPKAKEEYDKALALDPDGKVVNRTEIQKKLRESSIKGNR